METRADGFNYFTDYGHPDDEVKNITEFKYKSLGDGNVEVYSRDITSPFITNDFVRIQTMIKPDGSQNIHLITFSKTLQAHINASLFKRPVSGSGRMAISSDDRPRILNFNLREDLRRTMTSNGITMAPFINSAIAEKLEREGLL